MARIDDLLYVDDLTKHSDQIPTISKGCVTNHKGTGKISYSVPVSSTPYRTAFPTPTFSPAPLRNPAMGEHSPFISSTKTPKRGVGTRKVLTDYLSIDAKVKDHANHVGETSDLISKREHEGLSSQTGMESLDCAETAPTPLLRHSISE